MTPELGDVIGCQGGDWLSNAIRRCTGDGPLSHVGLLTALHPMAIVTEALAAGVVNTALDAVLAREAHVWLLRPPLRLDQRATAAAKMLSLVGTQYNFGDILLQLGDTITGNDWLTEHWASCKQVICSMSDCLAEPEIGLCPKDATPNDIWGIALVERWEMEQLK